MDCPAAYPLHVLQGESPGREFCRNDFLANPLISFRLIRITHELDSPIYEVYYCSREGNAAQRRAQGSRKDHRTKPQGTAECTSGGFFAAGHRAHTRGGGM